MRRSDFNYDLPAELIAQLPLPERSGSRLLELNGRDGHTTDRQFVELPQLLRQGDLLVLNDTRVVRARLFARKESGGAVELLLERVLQEDTKGLFQGRASKPLREGAMLQLAGGGSAKILERRGELIELAFSEPILKYLAQHGEVPLPPYIKRERADHAPPVEGQGEEGKGDAARYQTIFARVDGAVAAPTAGLHFDDAMLAALESAGVQRATVTLHVGAGTFQPVRADNLDEHKMHRERIEVDQTVCQAIEATRLRGGKVVAVGTTVVRSLESAARDGVLRPLRGETDLFIRPGYRFKVVDALLTNFHLPESTLLMLVCAFGGTENVLAAYRQAVEKRYRFFSYGDAMFVTPTEGAR